MDVSILSGQLGAGPVNYFPTVSLPHQIRVIAFGIEIDMLY